MSSRGGGFGGQPNMQQLMKRAQKMQQELEAAQAELAEAEVTGTRAAVSSRPPSPARAS